MKQEPAQPKRRRRWLRWTALATFLVVAVGGVVTYRTLTEPARVRRFAERWLQNICTTDVRLGEVQFSIWDGLRVSGLTIAAPGEAPGAPPVLTCVGVSLRFDLSALLKGHVRVATLAAEEVSATALFDPVAGRFDVQDVLRLPPADPDAPTPALPGLEIADLFLRLQCRTEHGVAPVDTVRISVSGRPIALDRYTFIWEAKQALRDAAGSFDVDFGKRELREATGGSPWLSLDTVRMVLAAAAPKAAGKFTELGVSGRVRTRGWTAHWGGAARGLRNLNLEFDQFGISLPLDDAERAFGADQRYVRLDNAAGRIELGEDSAKADLNGKFHGSVCAIQVTAKGPLHNGRDLAAAGIDVRATLHGMMLPRRGTDAPEAETRFINRWQRLRYFYNDFDPHGAADLDVHMEHPAGGGWNLAAARIAPQGMDAMHRSFPYRVYDLRGEVLLDSAGIHIRRLAGRHDEGVVDVEGWVSGAESSAAAEVFFAAHALPLTEDLCDALPGRYRTAWTRFRPSGYTDVDVRMAKVHPGDDSPWTTEVVADLKGVDAIFDGFGYPLGNLHGEIFVEGDTIAVRDVRGVAGEGALQIDGLARMHSTGLAGLDLSVIAQRVPFDERLRAALPPATLAKYEEFDPVGAAGFNAHLTWKPDPGEIDYDIALTLDDVSIRHAELPVPINDLGGKMRLRPEDVEIDGVAGKVAGGAVELAGRLKSGNAEAFGDIEVRCRGIRLDEAARSALPPAARAALADWLVEGEIAFDGGWERAENEAGAGRLRARLPLAGLTLRYVGFPLPVYISAGELTVDGSQMLLSGVRGGAEGARLALGGEIDFADDVKVDLRFTAAETRFTEALRAAAPWRLQRLWNDVQPSGSMGVRGGHISYLRPARGGPPQWTIDGELVFDDAAFAVGPTLRGLTGSVTLSGRGAGELADVPLQGNFTIAEVDVGAWPLRAVQGQFLREAPSGRWLFPLIHGTLFAGTLNGRLELVPSPRDTRYELNATVQGARLGDLAAEWRVASGPVEEVAGTLDARMYMSGSSGDPGGGRGGGRITLRDGNMYRLPLLLSVLNVINLTSPENAAFQEGDAEFYIVGSQLQVRSVMLKGPALALTGDGTMNLNSKELDLRLVATTPHQWARVPVVTQFLENAAREFMEIQVTGTPGDPRASARPLRRVEGAVDALISPRQRPRNP
jgi:hypothetical protein